MMSSADCALCAGLARAGVTTDEREVCPPEASALETFAPGEGHGGMVQIRRCPGCGALYRYRAHSEYSAGGSWDEEWLWRLPPAAEAAIAPVLAAEAPRRAGLLAAALRGPDAPTREAAALLLWICTGRGEDLAAAVPAAVEALADAAFLAGNYSYRGLLALASRDKAWAARIRAEIDRSGIEARDRQFAWILRKRCAEVEGA